MRSRFASFGIRFFWIHDFLTSEQVTPERMYINQMNQKSLRGSKFKTFRFSCLNENWNYNATLLVLIANKRLISYQNICFITSHSIHHCYPLMFELGTILRLLKGELSKFVSTGTRTYGRTFTLTIYGVLHRCECGYAGILRDTGYWWRALYQLLLAWLIQLYQYEFRDNSDSIAPTEHRRY